MGAYEDLLGRSSSGDDQGTSAGGGFRSGLMSQNAYRPSVNIQQQHIDPLVRFFLEAGALMPDDLRQEQGRPALTQSDRRAITETMNAQRPYMNPNDDVFGQNRMQYLGPSHPIDAPPEVLNALISGPSLNAPSFQSQVNDALFRQGVGGLLTGQQAPQDPAASALSTAVGPIDQGLIARLYGQLGQ